VSASPHFYTLTCNLLAERTLNFDGWSAGRTQRAVSESFQVGGKGINVSKMLNRLQAPNTALCFAGGMSGMECVTWLRNRGFRFAAFPAQAPTRTGTVVRDRHAPETTFLGPDAALDGAALAACVEFLDAQPSGQVLALCGSVPGWSSATCDPLRGALERWSQRGTLAIDTYGPPLAWAVRQPAALVKVNRAEFVGLFEDGLRADISAALSAAAERWPVRAWIVTDGADEVWSCERGCTPLATRPPAVPEVSATGSGDVLLAGVLDAMHRRGVPLQQALAFAIPLAAANAAHPGIAEFPLPEGAPRA
jgi:1-phosphofructokinase